MPVFRRARANFFMLLPEEGFRHVTGHPAQFTRSDLDGALTREFRATCGTHIVTRLPDRPQVVLKVGRLDDPAESFAARMIAIYTVDKQLFHVIGEGAPQFERLPQRG